MKHGIIVCGIVAVGVGLSFIDEDMPVIQHKEPPEYHLPLEFQRNQDASLYGLHTLGRQEWWK